METIVTIWRVRLSDAQIDAACLALLRGRRRVGVRDVMQALRHQHGVSGRTERVARILRRAEDQTLLGDVDTGALIAALRERVRIAETRAERAEELERRHQDYWAQRYADRVMELERARSTLGPTVTHEQYVELHRQLAAVSRRLARYEGVAATAEEGGSAASAPARP